MSNLFKQYYVVNEAGRNRVINSNSLVEEKMRQLAVGAKVPSSEKLPSLDVLAEGESSEFAEGLSAVVVEVPPEPDPKEVAKKILDEARAQADQMLNDANVEAKQILANAKEEAERVFEEQKMLGYENGATSREEELAELERQLQEEVKRIENEGNQKKLELESEYQLRLDEMEESVIDALIAVFDKVFHIQMQGQREILLGLVQNVLMNVELGNKIKIRVNEADKQMLEEHLEDIQGQIGKDVSLEMVMDIKLSDGQCQVETNYGVYDCGIDTQFVNLTKAIRSLIE